MQAGHVMQHAYQCCTSAIAGKELNGPSSTPYPETLP